MRNVVNSHPWHTECKCFETAIFEMHEEIPDGWLIWLEGDGGETAAYRRIASNPKCVCHQCQITQRTHNYLDSKGL